MALLLHNKSIATNKTGSRSVSCAAVPLNYVYYPTPVDTLVHTAAATELVSPLVLNHMPKPFLVVSAPFDLLDDMWAEDDSDAKIIEKQRQIRQKVKDIEDKAAAQMKNQKGTVAQQ